MKLNKHGGQSEERIYNAKTVCERGFLRIVIPKAKTDRKL